MTESDEDPRAKEFSELQRSGIEQRRLDQDRTLAAMHTLEVALSSAAPMREDLWHREVIETLSVLGAATQDEAENAARPDSLLSDISLNQPRLRNRVRGLRTQYRQLQESIGSLQRELEEPRDATVDFADIRQRLASVLASLRHQRGRESDLIYEAYYEAFKTDLGQDARHLGPQTED
jgi:hypothetical protein